MSPMSRSDARKREIQDRVNAMHDAIDKALMGAWPHPPTEPKEPDMTTDDRLAAILTDAAKMLRYQVDRLDEIHLLLDERLPEPARVPDPEWDCAACGEPEPTWQHECTDVTEELAVGSQVTDKDGDVWQRYADGWSQRTSARPDPDCRVSWEDVYQWGPLRLTTDADRERVGLPVDTARPASCCDRCPLTGSGTYDCTCEGNPRCAKAAEDVTEEPPVDAAPDVDPDEALREAIVSLTRRLHEADARAKKAEADVERLTRERDKYASTAERWQARYEALRADVEEEQVGRHPAGATYQAIARILDRNDERAKGEQR